MIGDLVWCSLNFVQMKNSKVEIKTDWIVVRSGSTSNDSREAAPLHLFAVCHGTWLSHT